MVCLADQFVAFGQLIRGNFDIGRSFDFDDFVRRKLPGQRVELTVINICP
jgi:hypothetical protein